MEHSYEYHSSNKRHVSSDGKGITILTLNSSFRLTPFLPLETRQKLTGAGYLSCTSLEQALIFTYMQCRSLFHVLHHSCHSE